MSFSTVKYTYPFFLTLIILSSSNEYPKRFLQYDYYGLNNEYSNSTNETNNNSTSASEDPGSYLLAWFFIFFFMGLYMICSMKKYPEISDKTDYVWKFMFFANNGILVASSVNIFNIKNMIIDSSPFALSTIVFIIGCIYYLKKYCETCSMGFAELYFQWDKISELNKMPCFIWSLVALTDPCCRSDTYTVTVYEDGHTESNECCVRMWNCFIFVIKRMAVIFTFLSFYIFLVFFILFWLIAKGIFILILNSKIKNAKNNNPNPEVPNDVNIQGNNINNINDKNGYPLSYDDFIKDPNQYIGNQNNIYNDKNSVNTNVENQDPMKDINNKYDYNGINPNNYNTINNNINNSNNNNEISNVNNNDIYKKDINNNDIYNNGVNNINNNDIYNNDINNINNNDINNINNNDIHDNQGNAFPGKDEVEQQMSKTVTNPENQINHEVNNHNINEHNEDEQQNENNNDNMNNAPPPI